MAKKPEKNAAKKIAKKEARAAGKGARKDAKTEAKKDKASTKEAARKKGKKKSRKVAPVPKGMSAVTPNLVFKDSVKAIEFYERAFGAKQLSLMPSPDGKSIWHAEIRIGDSVLFLSDASPRGGPVAPSPENRSTCAMQLFVKNCDAVYERALEAGATSTMPVSDMFWGDRMGSVVDPFGVSWMISTRVANLTPKQMAKAGEEFGRGMTAAEEPAMDPPVDETSASHASAVPEAAPTVGEMPAYETLEHEQ